MHKLVMESIVSIREVGRGMYQIVGYTAGITILVLTVSIEDVHAQCGIDGIPGQLTQDSSSPILNTSGSTAAVRILNGNYPTTIGVEDSNPGVGNVKAFSAGESGAVVAAPTTGLGMYDVEINNPGMGCIDTVVVEVVSVLPLELIESSIAWDGDSDIVIDYRTANRSNTEETCVDIADDDDHNLQFFEAECVVYDEPNSSEVEDFSMRITRQEIEDIIGRLRPGQTIYLRLRNEDLDGAQQIQPMVVLTVDDNGEAFYSIIYPNPVAQGQNLTIETNVQGGPLYISVINANGQEVMNQVSIGGSRVTFQNNLPRGIYAARISDSSDGRGNTDIQRFIVK